MPYLTGERLTYRVTGEPVTVVQDFGGSQLDVRTVEAPGKIGRTFWVYRHEVERPEPEPEMVPCNAWVAPTYANKCPKEGVHRCTSCRGEVRYCDEHFDGRGGMCNLRKHS